MGLLDSVFGQPGGPSGQVKDAGWDLWGQYGNVGDLYNPQTEQSMAMSNFNRQGQMGQAAGYGKIAGSGYRPSGGVDYMALARQMYAANLGQSTRDKKREWQWRGMQGQSQMYPTLLGANTQPASQGLLGAAVQLAPYFM